MELNSIIRHLVCPVTHGKLTLVSLDDSRDRDLTPLRRTGTDLRAIGRTETLLQNEESGGAYPVVDGYPVLMAPEFLVPSATRDDCAVVDIQDPRYAEAYQEMLVYNKMCDDMIEAATMSSDDTVNRPMGALRPSTTIDQAEFPFPEELWVDAKHDSLSQLEAYAHLAPVTGKIFLQMGGSGSHAVKALLAGASEALLLTPMLGEARVASYLADAYGVGERLGCVIAIGEETPFKDGGIDLIYSGGCFHHMRLDYASRELHRILSKGGRFSGVDPWKTPLHTIGTRLIGKREKSVFCRPITPERLAHVKAQFSDMTVTNHGPLLRYLFLAIQKLGIEFPIRTMLRIGRSDDWFGRLVGLSRFGGSLMIAGRKQTGPPSS